MLLEERIARELARVSQESEVDGVVINQSDLDWHVEHFWQDYLPFARKVLEAHKEEQRQWLKNALDQIEKGEKPVNYVDLWD